MTRFEQKICCSCESRNDEKNLNIEYQIPDISCVVSVPHNNRQVRA
ncbi:Uncharacterized protein dnm_073640 [Desulfonema magnum]|uniref:Uncharacterized protein n=1 Tax=Desulfonema magnum TaxID=45655 RepID=A0A975BUC4_9BACT|nr:Uncharacterized protein dnm_073640 [Desulfonema magnum]